MKKSYLVECYRFIVACTKERILHGKAFLKQRMNIYINCFF